MKRSLLINLALAAFVAALAAWMALRPGETPAPQVPLTHLKRDQIAEIRIQRRNLPEFVLEKVDGQWFQRQPFPARADTTQIGRLVDLVSATASQTLPATDLGRFDLDDPFARVTLGPETFAFGSVNEMTTEQYVLAGDRVFLLSPVFGYGLPTRRESLATHMLLAENEVPVAIATSQFRVAKHDGKLALTPEDPSAPSQDDLAKWLDQWRFASSLATQEAPATPRGERVSVTLEDGRVVEFVVVRRAPELLIVRPDEKLQFVFPADKADRLLSRPSKP